MAQFSDSQLVVLSAACQRPDRSVYPLTAKLSGGAAAKVLGSLLKKGLVKEMQAKREDTVWREDRLVRCGSSLVGEWAAPHSTTAGD